MRSGHHRGAWACAACALIITSTRILDPRALILCAWLATIRTLGNSIREPSLIGFLPMDTNFVWYVATVALPVIPFLKVTVARRKIWCLRGKTRASFVCRGRMMGINPRIFLIGTNMRTRNMRHCVNIWILITSMRNRMHGVHAQCTVQRVQWSLFAFAEVSKIAKFLAIFL